MIATRRRKTYLRLMVARRLIRILTMLALLVAPLGMVGGHAAMAMPVAATAATGHCADIGGMADDGDGSSQEDRSAIDCTISCSALPALAGALTDQPPLPAMARTVTLHGLVRGLHPESDDPPPRTA